MWVPRGKTLMFLSPLASLKFYDFLSFLFILKLSYAKPFCNSLNYASTANIEEVMKFYNLGDKTFETDFSTNIHLVDRDILKFTSLQSFLHYSGKLEFQS